MKKILWPFWAVLCLCACQKEAVQPMEVSRSPAPVPTQAGPAVCAAQYAEKLRVCEPFTCVENIDLNGPKTLTRTVVGKQDGLCVETTAWKSMAEKSTAPDKWPAQWEQTCRFPMDAQQQQADYLARYFSMEKKITPQAQLLLPPQGIDAADNPLADFLQQQICVRPALAEETTAPPVSCTGTESITVIWPDKNGAPSAQTVRCED